MKVIRLVAILLVLAAAAGAAIAYSGIVNVAADDPHWKITYRLLELARDRSIALRARDIEVPALDDPALIAEGAHHYEEMCTGCHLAPGSSETELRRGLYPKPPELARHARRLAPAEAFWVTKHGLKMTGMPAWGRTHDDESLWGLVAFLQKLPELTPEAYRELAGERDGHGPGRGRGHGGHDADSDDAETMDDSHSGPRGHSDEGKPPHSH